MAILKMAKFGPVISAWEAARFNITVSTIKRMPFRTWQKWKLLCPKLDEWRKLTLFRRWNVMKFPAFWSRWSWRLANWYKKYKEGTGFNRLSAAETSTARTCSERASWVPRRDVKKLSIILSNELSSSVWRFSIESDSACYLYSYAN